MNLATSSRAIRFTARSTTFRTVGLFGSSVAGAGLASVPPGCDRPAASGRGFPPRNAEFEDAAIDIDAGDFDVNLIAESILVACAATDERMGRLFVIVEVFGQGGDRDEAFGGEFDPLAVEAEVLDAGDDGGHLLADACGEVGEELDFDQFAFGVGGAAFGARAMLGECRKPLRVGFEQRFELFPVGEQPHDPMNGQVGIAADRTGVVAVVFAGEGVVPQILDRVFGLFHTAEESIVDRLLRGEFFDLLQEFLEVATALRALQLEAERFDELGEAEEFEFVGVSVRAADERDFSFGEFLGDGDIRGEHELLDNLVADVVRDEVRAGDLVFFIEVDFDFGHGQFERAGREASSTEEHGEFEHTPEKIEDLGLDVRMFLFRMLEDVEDFLVGEAFGGFDCGIGKRAMEGNALGREFDEDRFRVAESPLLQAGESVGDDLGEHRDDAVGEINTGASHLRFAVESRPGGDKMGDVRNMDAEVPVTVFGTGQ